MISLELIDEIKALNPWIDDAKAEMPIAAQYIPRIQETYLLKPVWDEFWTILVGPRRSGKTTLGFHLCQRILQLKRYKQLVYLNCDFKHVRENLTSPTVIIDLLKIFNVREVILFIDEAQRLENPGLLLKAIIDLKLPLKLIASGSSQLEMKSKIQEFLTGREIESIVLPMSIPESQGMLEERLIYGAYPKILQEDEKKTILSQLYKRYIQKDIIEILKMKMPELVEKLMTLIAHSSGQLVNYQQLATDCSVSIPTVKSYLNILENTFVLHKVTPFVGNKRTEITSNPVYYFIDNGFRNQALKNFSNLDLRIDLGLLIESFVFQEILKNKYQNFSDYDIHFWRTRNNAEVDFVLVFGERALLPVEVKYRNIKKPSISRAYRSFLQAYQPKLGVIVTKSILASEVYEGCKVEFIPLAMLKNMLDIINQADKEEG